MLTSIRKRFAALTAISVTVFSCYSTTSFAAQSIDVDKVRSDVKQALRDFHIPGAAVAIVADGEVVLAEGFGITDIDTHTSVDADTAFGIASNTKAFTTTALAMLVEQGKLDWDDKVIDYIPEFRLADPYVTANATIRDIVSHRIGLGLGAGDLSIWPASDKSVAEIIAGLDELPLVSGFRDDYHYNNLMFVVAGEIVSRVSGQSWNDYIEQHIFKPLQMQHSAAGVSRLPTSQKRAVGHVDFEGELQRLPLDYLEDFRGAGAIASTANDMSQWLLTQLQGGVIPNSTTQQRLFQAKQQQQLWHPNIMNPVQLDNPDTHFSGYAMGFVVSDFHGYRKVGHSGGILGMVSLLTMVPEQQFGMIIMTNQQAFPALTAVTNEVLEQALGLPDKDWLADNLNSYQQFVARKAAAAQAPAVEERRPSLNASAYAGSYQDPWYGEVKIKHFDGSLHIRFSHTPLLTGRLEHYNNDTFVVHWQNPLLEADAFINFNVDEQGQVQGATMKAVSPFTDFSFDFHNLHLQRQQAAE